MGRFYQPAQAPQFIEGMYTPPWELIDRKLQENQTGYDNAIGTANLFNNVDIQHIDDPNLKAEAESLKKYYTDKAGALSEAIQRDPMAWKKIMPQIQQVGQEFTNDMKSGRVAEMQKQAQQLQMFLKDHEEYRKKYGEDFNRGYSYYMNEFKKDPLRRGSFNYDQLAAPIDQEKLIKEVQDIKASATEQTNGLWLVGTKEVPKEQVESAARSFVYGRPENAGYLAQQRRFGNENFYDAEYEKLHPETGGLYEEIYYNPADHKMLGNRNDTEVQNRLRQYQKDVEHYTSLSKAKQEKAVRPTLNLEEKKGSIGRMFDEAVSAGSYKETSIKENPWEMARVKNNQALALENIRQVGADKRANTANVFKAQQMGVDLYKSLETAKSKVDPLTVEGQTSIKNIEAKQKELWGNILGTSVNTADKNLDAMLKAGSPVTKGSSTAKGAPTVKSAPDGLPVPLSLSGVAPSSFAELQIEAQGAPRGSTYKDLYETYTKRIESSINKAVDPKKKQYLKDFFNYFKKEANSSDTLEGMAKKFARRNKYSKEEPVHDYVYSGMYSGNTDLLNAAKSESNRLNADIKFIVSGLNYYHFGEIEKNIKDNAVTSKQFEVYPASEELNSQLNKLIPLNKTAFTVRSFDDNQYGDILSDSKADVMGIKNGNGNIKYVFNGAIGNDKKGAYIAELNGKRFIVEPNGGGAVAKTVDNLMALPGATTLGENSPFHLTREQPYIKDIQDKLDVLSNTAPTVLKDGTKISSYATPVYSKSGKSYDITFRQVDKGYGVGYVALLDDMPIFNDVAPTLYNENGRPGLYEAVRQTLK